MLGFRFPDAGPGFYRFLRVVFAAGAVAVVGEAITSIGLLELPAYVTPIAVAALVALDKYLRDRFATA